VFAINLSAPFLCQFFKDPMDQTSPYWDYLFGNESEALAYAESHDLKTTSISEIAKHIALLPKANSQRERVVVITQGADATIVAIAREGGKVDVSEYPTAKIASEEIVDTNGAGDAFAGGFLGKLIQGGDIETCVKAGQWLAGLCLRQNGPAYVLPKNILISDTPFRNNNSRHRR
jgi:adenosine kinase